MSAPVTTLEIAQAYIAMALLGVSLVALPVALGGMANHFAASRRLAAVLAGAVACAALARWGLAPLRMSTVFAGYGWTENAIDLYPLPRYGAGAVAFYHGLFAVLPGDHRTIMMVNAVAGVVTIPLFAAWVSRLFDKRASGVAAAVMVALMPLLIRNDTSDANNVPVLLWLFGGLVLLGEYQSERRRTHLWLACALLTLAAISRPEMPILVGLLVVLTLSRSGLADALRTRWLWLAAAVSTLALTPHLIHVTRAAVRLEGAGDLPGWSAGRLLGLPRWALWDTNILVTPTLFPAGLLLLGALAVALSRGSVRRRAMALCGVCVAAVLVYAPDLDWSNRARVLVPAALLLTALAGHGAARLLEVRSKGIGAAVLAVVAASAIPSLFPLWQPTNEDAEEAMIRDTMRQLPGDVPITFVRPGPQDRNAHGDRLTHTYFPDYLVRARNRQARIVSLSQWLAAPDRSRPAYLYYGVRCFARFRSAGAERPRGTNEQPHCRALRTRAHLRPVIRRSIRNRGDVSIHYYGDAPKLPLGLFIIEADRR